MTTAAYRVLLDSNILISRTLRDWIYLLSYESGEGLYQVLHTRDIQAEVDYHRRRSAPHADDAELAAMWTHIETMTTSRMIEGFTVDPQRPEYQNFPDKHDLHVVEAARSVPVDALITNDSGLLKWFELVGDDLEFEVLDADEFLMQIIEYTPENFRLHVLRNQLKYWGQKSKDSRSHSVDLDAKLLAAGAPRFASEIRLLLQKMARS